MSNLETTDAGRDEATVTEQKVPNPLATKDAVEQLMKTTRKLMKTNGHNDV